MNSPSTRVRFVVLHHTGVKEPHFDLMVGAEVGKPLMTWRLSAWPISTGEQIERIGDHRVTYLKYEGPISGDRGEVRRVAEGFCDLRIEAAQVVMGLGEQRIELPM